jgi:hypothetical protein
MKSYFEHFGRSPDFRVRYRTLDREVQRRPQLLFQHIRSDYCYAQPTEGDQFENYFMIHPEFESGDGGIISEDEVVPPTGTAGMWILVDEMRNFHRERIRIGVKGFMMEGPYRLAEIVVIEVVSLAY